MHYNREPHRHNNSLLELHAVVCWHGCGEMRLSALYIYKSIVLTFIKDATVYFNAHFGESSGPYHLDNLYCDGYETNLLNCRRQDTEVGVHRCSPGNEAGVRCDGIQMFEQPIYFVNLVLCR